MEIGKYIHELLLENDIVVVPGFGAFVSEYKPAEINEDSDEIKPPSKVVSLNLQLRNNDGLLVGHVADKKRISHFDALKKIEKEREDILYKLDSGEKVELDELGVLYSTKETPIVFTAVEDDNLLLDAYGLEPTSIDVPESEDERNEEIAPIITHGEVEGVPAPDESNEAAVEISEVPEEKAKEEEVAEEEKIVTATEVNDSLINEPEEKEEKKKRGWLWLLLVLIPLIAVSVFVFMKGLNDGTKDKVQPENVAPIKQELPAIIPADTVQADSTLTISQDSVLANPKDSVAAEANDVNNLEELTTEAKYYLVGGSFSVEENADEYLNELKTRGYKAFRAGKKGRFFIVAIGAYNSFNEAENARVEYMSNNAGSEVWVWKKL